MRFHVFYNGGSGGNKDYSRRYEDAITPQNKAMNDSHISQLMTEWLLKHNPPQNIVNNVGAMKAWRLGAERQAREWAVANEPKRFLNPLLRSMNGIPADLEMRRNRLGNTAKLSSSWIGDGTVDVNGNTVNIMLGDKKYTYGTTPQGIKEFYESPSLGKVVSDLSRANPGTTMHGLTKLWETRNRFNHRSNRGWTGDYKHGRYKTDRTGRR